MILRTATREDAPALAALHAQAFDRPWSAQAFTDLLASPGVAALSASDASERLAGFILVRAVLDEAEVLTLATAPACRRRGVARALVEAAVAASQGAGAGVMWLEVAADNPTAHGLYAAAGFVQAAVRRGYYARPGGPSVDALILRRTLKP